MALINTGKLHVLYIPPFSRSIGRNRLLVPSTFPHGRQDSLKI